MDKDEELTENENEIENNEALPQEDNLNEENTQMDIEPPKSGHFLGVASKDLIKKLLKTKLAIALVPFVIIIIALVAILGISVSTNTTDYLYVENKCQNVTVKYDVLGGNYNFETLDMEKYVANATYTYTKDFNDFDEANYYHIYKSLAVALRTEAVNNNCNITYNFKLQTYSNNNKTLNRALEQSNGLIATYVNKKKVIPVKVSMFCYDQLASDYYTIFGVPDFKIPAQYIEENIKDDVYKHCPCNQPNEDNPSCWYEDDTGFRKWRHNDDTSGYNVYAAKYLLDEYGLGGDDILSYFIGNFQYKTIYKDEEDEDEKTNINCGAMDLHKTTLTKNQFVRGLENYDGNSSTSMEFFKENAGLIYDLGVENNLNPEFIVARAISEGFSPMDKQPTSYNFWGWNCTNPQFGADCKHYAKDLDKSGGLSSTVFAQAIKEYCSDVNASYKDMDDLLMRYAQLGKYWYNPGGNSLGGCNYKNEVFPDGLPSRVADACAADKSCNAAGVGYCIPVLEEEQYKYGQWQMRKMNATRKAIWGLEEGDCEQEASGAGCLWWPIGSADTTDEGGITYAKNEPEATVITSPFGTRSSPIAGASTNHNAIDIGGGVEGVTNVIAAADGQVTIVTTGCIPGIYSCGGMLGNSVYITHSDGSKTRYGHLDRVLVSAGDFVKQGQVIGKLGNTGNSTGPHLDFQVNVNGSPVNPLNYVSSANPRPICNGDGSFVSGNTNQQSICKTLKKNNYPDEAIAVILNNINAESGFNPDALNTSSGSLAYGIIQWTGSRKKALIDTYGEDSNVLENQIKFMLNELKNSYQSVDNYIKSSDNTITLAEKESKFCNVFEEPGEYYCNQRAPYVDRYFEYVLNDCGE